MIYSAEHIKQPYSGEYIEKIYDISSPWNSSDWTWIKFVDENGEWCGEFRGKYRGVSVSKKLGIVVVLTSNYMFVLDINTTDIIEYDEQPDYMDITTSPNEDILVTDGYSIEIFNRNKDGKIETMPVPNIPVQPDDLKFVKWNDNVLEMSCCEFLKWENELVLHLNCDSMEWVDNLQSKKSIELKTLKYLKRTKYVTLLYLFFCLFSLVAVYSSEFQMLNSIRYFKFAAATLLLWATNPMVFIVSLLGFKAYFVERKDTEKRNMIGKKWILFFLWNIVVVVAWYISLFFWIYFTGGV